MDYLQKAININPDKADSYYSLAVAQESYAHQLLNMNIQASSEKNIDSDDADDTEADAQDQEDTAVSMSPTQRKTTAIELYTAAISSYKTYLEKAKEAKDSVEINNEINSLEEKIKQLGLCN